MAFGRFTPRLRGRRPSHEGDETAPPAGPAEERLRGPDDWYRGTTWSLADQEFFEMKLARARKGNRAQYVRIQGSYLTDSPDPAAQEAGVALLERVIDEYPDDVMSVADAHAELAAWHRRHGNTEAAAAGLGATLEAEQGTNVEHGADLDLAALIAEDPSAGELQEAERILATIVGKGEVDLLFRSQQFTYAVARSRLAERRGDLDLAAAYAHGALWLAEHDGPTAVRHPDVGLIGDQATAVFAELSSRAAAGNAEAANPAVEEFRRADGSVAWEWALTVRLHERPRGDRAAKGTGEQEVAQPTRRAQLLQELRAQGVEVFDLKRCSLRDLSSTAEARRIAPILLRVLDEPDEGDLHWDVWSTLHDRRARRELAIPVIEHFRAMGDSRNGHEVLLGNIIKAVARDEHLDLLEPMIRDPGFRGTKAYLWWAVEYMTSERAVQLCLDMLDEPSERIDALRALGDIKTELAAETLATIASQEPIPLTRKQTQYWLRQEDPDDFVRHAEALNAEIEIAADALGKLERARAKGKSRHAG